jgi:oxaloacetate decarboxylase beta subunit
MDVSAADSTQATSKLEQLWNLTAISDVTWQMAGMWVIIAVLFYLAVYRKFEPLLLVPIAFGALLANLPTEGLINPPVGEHGGGLYYYISKGVELEIFPPLIFLGVGALTDFGPLIANPRTLLLGAAAQFGVFATFLGAILIGFSPMEAGAIGIIGGADGPTSIFLANKLAPHLLAPIAVAAYSYMALVPLLQPPIMRALTTDAERKIRMRSLRKVSRLEKLIFATMVTVVVILLVPAASALIGMLMLGNFLRESEVTERLTKAAQNEIINIVTIFLGTSVGITMTGDRFLNFDTLKILALGVIAFGIATASGVLMAKVMNLFLKDNKINPLIGSAGVSAVPMAARVSQVEGQRADPGNFLLMHAMGPNVAGVIGTAVVAGYFIAWYAN